MAGCLASKWCLVADPPATHLHKTTPPGGSPAVAVVGGPGNVGFANASAIDNTATFGATGTQALRLTA